MRDKANQATLIAMARHDRRLAGIAAMQERGPLIDAKAALVRLFAVTLIALPCQHWGDVVLVVDLARRGRRQSGVAGRGGVAWAWSQRQARHQDSDDRQSLGTGFSRLQPVLTDDRHFAWKAGLQPLTHA